MPKLRVAMLLPGLGRVQRGAEAAFLEIARGLAASPDVSVSLFGSGTQSPEGLSIANVGCIPRERFERWPRLPILRTEYAYEELSFILRIISRRSFRPRDFDVALHCSFPFTNWFLRRMEKRGGPRSVFVTQNGDWTCRAESKEFRSFRCAGLVCTNPEYYERHKDTYPCALIPNGVDPARYHPRDASFVRDPRLPADRRIILIASALIESKLVLNALTAAALVPEAFVVVAGDGPQRDDVRNLANEKLAGRHLILGSVPSGEMPALYRQANLFLHSSRDEPFGIVYLEAAASGLPIVADDNTTTRWILGPAGTYADTRNIEATATAIRTALSQPPSTLGRDRVLQDWTWTQQTARYRSFLQTIARQPRQRLAA